MKEKDFKIYLKEEKRVENLCNRKQNEKKKIEKVHKFSTPFCMSWIH